MYKNKALVDRMLNTPSVNDNNVMMYRKLTSLIEQYNIMARDKGLPVKKIPVYDDSMNRTLMVQSISNILKDISKIRGIKNKNIGGEKILRDVTFEGDQFTNGIWTYTIINDDDIAVTLNTGIFSTQFTEDTITLGYNEMPYEKLITSDGEVYSTASYKYMFNYLPYRVTTLTIDNWTNRKVTDMSYMFSDCSSLQSLTLGDNFNTSSLTNMRYMFYGCSKLQSLTLGDKFDTSSVTDMSYMFYYCQKLTLLTLDNFDTSSVTNMTNMFGECSSLQSLTLGDNFNISSVTDIGIMFWRCIALTSVSLYKSAESIIMQLPTATDTWTVTNGASETPIGNIDILQGAQATWKPTNLPDSWGDAQWTLTRTVQPPS